jgi:hypothetical protein
MPVIHPVSPQILKALLDLADNKRDVATTSDYPSLAVIVPDYLLERYNRYQAIDSSSPIEPKKSGAKK